MEKIFLGVDGGNSKTDYLLYTARGEFVDIVRMPTCSHEQMKDGFDGAQRAMGEQLRAVLERNKLTAADLAYSAFGLAGADTTGQIAELRGRVGNLGMSDFVLANDGVLGIKAVASSGVCAINGAGTVIVGIDGGGNTLQVGGVGQMSGDFAGGAHVMHRGIQAAYSYRFRNGPYSSIVPLIYEILGLGGPYELHEAIANRSLLYSKMTDIIAAVDKEAVAGDVVAKEIMDAAGENVAQGVIGLIREMRLPEPVTVVLAGSLWHKSEYGGMLGAFQNILRDFCRYQIHVLSAPPAAGGVFWAMEMYGIQVDAAFRDNVLSFLTPEKYEALTAISP